MKYYRENIFIEAIQISETTEFEIKKWSNGRVYASPVLEPSEDNHKGCYWQIETTNGIYTAIPGDFIIKNVNGELSVCKPTIFEKTYQTLN
jgi:hypothetical protein